VTQDRHPSSFRDPSGFVFTREGVLFRQVQESYRPHFEKLMASGLYEALVRDRLLVPHEEDAGALQWADPPAYKVLRPAVVPFLSFPYEWCFGELKDAALLTLKVLDLALDRGLVLKDASALNVQFYQGSPVLIDTLSFEIQKPGEPWVAYRQFCRHFLAPLALMAHVDGRLGILQQGFPDGLPLDLASRLLPLRTRLSLGLGLHLHAHAKFERRYSDGAGHPPPQMKGRRGPNLKALADSLRSCVESLKLPSRRTRWSGYELLGSYSEEALRHKREWVAGALDELRPATLWDFGANRGEFSQLASARGIATLAFDQDPWAVEEAYREAKSRRDENLLPLVLDLLNPSPDSGWENAERASLFRRAPANTVMALALVHHLAIGANLPLGRVASFLARCGRSLIIEFVPKEDPQVRQMLAIRDDIFPEYTVEGFEAAFSRHFRIKRAEPLLDSVRRLYLMERAVPE
jgi:hypothetical protein